jgi:hypothetical protein
MKLVDTNLDLVFLNTDNFGKGTIHSYKGTEHGEVSLFLLYMDITGKRRDCFNILPEGIKQ